MIRVADANRANGREVMAEPVGPAEGADLCAAVRCVDDLLRATPGRLSRLRVASGEATIELEWQPSPPPFGPGAVTAPQVSTDILAGTDDPEPGRPPGECVRSPLVGTFYRAPEPGSPPFVVEGVAVAVGDVVGIVEAMKLMNSILAPVAGRVVHVAALDGGRVEYNELLLVIVPETDEE